MRVPKIKDYPKELFLKGDCYKVVFVKNLKNLGEVDPSSHTLRIRAGMSRNETFKTFIHEVLHIIEFSWPLPIPHKLVYNLEEAIFSFLLDNFFTENE